MHNIKYLIKKKLNKLGLRKKFDESAICKMARDFISQYLKEINVSVEAYHYGCLIIKASNAAEASEINFFQQELLFFLEKNGYKIRKIRIIY